MPTENAERLRLTEADRGDRLWKLWGPYVADRQWGTVREDYSARGDVWTYFTHEMARSRTYRWGEDGIGGVSDRRQRLCLALALWNERDPYLKERLFGLTGPQGNHGEDVKELYYYLDATPTFSYGRMLYKYPQARFPYERLVQENARRGYGDPEFELLDSGVFDDDRYFDVFVEYAKAGPTDLLVRITAWNRGPETAPLHLLPHLWFRNTWTWKPHAEVPVIRATAANAVEVVRERLASYQLHCGSMGTTAAGSEGGLPGGTSGGFSGGSGSREGSASEAQLLFTHNDTNPQIFDEAPVPGAFYKDGIHRRVVDGDEAAVNPAGEGTKVAAWYRAQVPPSGSAQILLRLTDRPGAQPFEGAEDVIARRIEEADVFYGDLQAGMESADARNIHRQALAGLIWSKQYYHFDVHRWLEGDATQPPPPPERKLGRNTAWVHLDNSEIISMPDKWEYPWYAAWDLAFHCVPLAMIDAEFAKEQLVLLTRDWYQHPNGQLPAYEWSFGDANPPVHAWAAWRVYKMDQRQRGGRGDLGFLKRILHKLLLNFTWWVNRKDPHGHNIFQGGFLGLDNIGVFDRSSPAPDGAHLEQADGTSWMAMYCLNLLRISIELATHDRSYEDLATKFFEHFLYIAAAMTDISVEHIDLWDAKDEFFYDALHICDESGEHCHAVPLRVRSMVGLVPLFAVETLELEHLKVLPEFHRRMDWFLQYRPDLATLVSRWTEAGRGERRMLALLRGHRLKRVLRRMLDETEFLSPYGVRSLSKYHDAHPYVFETGAAESVVRYRPAESDSGLFGGNSNWRGPVWIPMNFLIIESLQKFHHYYGDDFVVEYPTGSGVKLNLLQIADELAARVTRLFLRDESGRRPIQGDVERLQTDPHFRDHILFYEYFHGDDGRGLGASHQTGWTALVAKLMQPRAPR